MLEYLGVWPTPWLATISENNFLPLIKAIERDLKSWHSKHFSDSARPPLSKLRNYQRFFIHHALYQSKYQSFFRFLRFIQGQLPDFKQYYYVSHLARIIDWHCHGYSKDWVSLESGIGPIPLLFSPWIPWDSYPNSLKTLPLTGNTLAIFHLLARR